MVEGYRYIQIDEKGRVSCACDRPVIIDGKEITIDTEGMTVPEMPTDAVYALYYNETKCLHWVKRADFEEPTLAPLTDQEQIAIDTALNVEYMVCLMEANMGLM